MNSLFHSPFENATQELHKLKQDLNQEKLFYREELTCRCCKTRLSDFLETGYVGCAECYKLFDREITQSLYDFHKAVKHTGKRPEIVDSKAKKQKEIDLLLAQQADASAKEEFLLAQSIKEKIEALRREL